MTKSYKAALAIVFAAGLFSAAWAKDLDFPKIKHLAIQPEITRDVIDILPGRGVKVIFPWVLSRQSGDTPYKAWITNNRVFDQMDEEGQNYILYKLRIIDPRFDGEVCDAFVNVHGYHFSFTLRASFSRKTHNSNVIIDISDAQKIELIEKAVHRRMAAIAKEYELKEKELDARAKKLSLKLVGGLALESPKKSGVYEKEKLKLSSGDRIIFQADKMLSYGDIHIIQIQAHNDSRKDPIYISGIALEKTSGDTKPLMSEYEFVPRLDPGEKAKGFVVTQDSRVLNSDDTQMSLFTDKGKVVLTW
ncbi:MAG: hypothetical protein GY874_12945 [Desulfobacteraceae bacterium]|nr:hypothetical protein [Desulfobacteraceae bacterium]